MQKYDGDFAQIIEGFLKETGNFGEMDNKTGSLVVLACVTAIQIWKLIPSVVKEALIHGADVTEIKETLYQTAPYIGAAKVMEALDQVNEELLAQGKEPLADSQSTVEENTRFEKGLSLQQQIFGKENINHMRESAPADVGHIQDYLSANCFGDYYTRGGLDLKMRELITFVAICSIGGCEPQAKAHAAANVSVGNTRQILIEAITRCLPYIGYPRTLNALSCINEAGPKS